MALDLPSYLLGKSKGGGGGGTSDYTQLSNKPQINSVELSGNKTLANLGIQSEITSTNKLDADLVDDTNSTNKFFSGNYNDLTNKPIVPKIQYIEQDTSSPFVFSGTKKGIYIFPSTSSFSYKIKSDSDTKTLVKTYVPLIIMESDYEYVSEEPIPCIIFSVKINTSNSDGLQNEIYTNPSITNMALTTNKRAAGYYLTTTNQTITGLKSFESIPRQSDTTAPTNDKEFTNKKYVDDQISGAIGSINTILATLTTPSNNGGGE